MGLGRMVLKDHKDLSLRLSEDILSAGAVSGGLAGRVLEKG